jgi:hypothetical protein
MPRHGRTRRGGGDRRASSWPRDGASSARWWSRAASAAASSEWCSWPTGPSSTSSPTRPAPTSAGTGSSVQAPVQLILQIVAWLAPCEMALTHFIVSDDVERSCRFSCEVLGGTVVRSGEPSYVTLANSWIIIKLGGGPTDDKPTVTLETPPDPDRTSSFLHIRVSDIEAVYARWSARGAEFLTPPQRHATPAALLGPGPRRPPDRGRPDDAARRLAAVPGRRVTPPGIYRGPRRSQRFPTQSRNTATRP